MKKLALTIIIFLVTATAMPLCNVLAQTRTVGVSAGNTFKYNYIVDYSISNDTSFNLSSLLEPAFEEAKNIEWAQMSILNVSGTTVTAQTLLHFKNGTEQINVATTDIDSGQGNLTMFLVAQNLNQNEPIYSDNTGQNLETINETVTRNYPSGPRQLNHQSIIIDYNLTQDEAATYNMTSFQQHNTEDIFWDKQTGVLMEMTYNMSTVSQTFNANITAKIALIESNTLTLPEFPTFIAVALVIFASGIAAVIFRRKRNP